MDIASKAALPLQEIERSWRARHVTASAMVSIASPEALVVPSTTIGELIVVPSQSCPSQIPLEDTG